MGWMKWRSWYVSRCGRILDRIGNFEGKSGSGWNLLVITFVMKACSPHHGLVTWLPARSWAWIRREKGRSPFFRFGWPFPPFFGPFPSRSHPRSCARNQRKLRELSVHYVESCYYLAVCTMKWLTKVTRRFFWMASKLVKSIEAAVRELVRSGAAGDTVASSRWLDAGDMTALIISPLLPWAEVCTNR